MDKTGIAPYNTTGKNDWETPCYVYEYLDSLFGFDFDPCPTNPTFDGLSIEWGKSNYVNPPYASKEQDRWVKKAYEEFKKGKLVVLLIPSRTDTKRWHDYIMKASEVWFIKGRINFKGGKSQSTFPSAVVVFDPRTNGNTRYKSLSIENQKEGGE